VGGGRGAPLTSGSSLPSNTVLIERPASPAEPAPSHQDQARRVSGLQAGNCQRQEVKTDYFGFTGKAKRKGRDLKAAESRPVV
jgi:hypothetical protein